MTGIIAIEIVLLLGLVAGVFWFNSKKYKDVKEWRDRKAEIASLLQEREKAEKEVFQLWKEAAEYQDQISANRMIHTELEYENKSIQEKIDISKQRLIDLEYAEEAIREKQVKERELWYAAYKYQQEQELSLAAKEFAEQFNAQAAVKLNIGADIAKEIAHLKEMAHSAVEIAKLREADKTAKDFYRLQIDESALEDIKELREVMGRLNQPEVLGKLIWKVYYEKPYTDLCGRIFAKPIMGIYKITNLENEMCYVGQAVNIADRWKQHIKRAIGAEPMTQNKLYPAMSKVGVENFTFQVLEVITDKKMLDAQEDYWQDFYKAKEFGYSIK